MTVETGGNRRGLIGRWLMRFEAAGNVLRLLFQGTTAVSALSGVLTYAGYRPLVPYVLGVGVVFVAAFAWIYVEYGVFNRKNRERVDRGNNFASPRDIIDDTLIGTSVFAAVHGREPTPEELETIQTSVRGQWEDFRDGVEVGER